MKERLLLCLLMVAAEGSGLHASRSKTVAPANSLLADIFLLAMGCFVDLGGIEIRPVFKQQSMNINEKNN